MTSTLEDFTAKYEQITSRLDNQISSYISQNDLSNHVADNLQPRPTMSDASTQTDNLPFRVLFPTGGSQFIFRAVFSLCEDTLGQDRLMLINILEFI